MTNERGVVVFMPKYKITALSFITEGLHYKRDKLSRSSSTAEEDFINIDRCSIWASFRVDQLINYEKAIRLGDFFHLKSVSKTIKFYQGFIL